MIRRLGLLASLLVLALLPLTSSPRGSSGVAGSLERPNVVVVTTDDQEVASTEFMPRLQRLVADRGVTFARHTVAFSLCCPSRATFLSGQFSHNNNVRSNGPPNGGYARLNTNETLPVWLQAAGYATGHVGKYPNGYEATSHPLTSGVPPGWTDWRGAVDPTTYYFYNYTLNENGRLVTYGSSEADYQTDVLTQKAADFIEDRSPRPEPFFLSVDYLAPHWESPPGSPDNLTVPAGDGGPESLNAPPEPAPRHKGQFAGATAPRPPSFDRDPADKPEVFRSRTEPLTQAQKDRIDEWYRARLESLQAVDEGIEKLIHTLEDAGELDNTVFVFTSDNGWFQGEHRITEGKIHVYEPSTRIPLVVAGPGVAAGARVEEWTSNVDVPATILALAGAQATLPQDGMSLVQYLSAPATDLGRVVFHETYMPAGGRGYAAIRAGHWKYVEYATGEKELYHLSSDPHELERLEGDKSKEAVVARLSAMLQPLKTCAGAACVVTGETP